MTAYGKGKVMQKGRSMIEMLGVLAIVGLLSVGGLMGYNIAMRKHNTNQAIELMQRLITQIQGFHEGAYTSLSLEFLRAAGFIDLEQCADSSGGHCMGDEIRLPIGNLQIASTKNQFSLTIKDVPNAICAPMAIADWGTKETGFFEFNIGGQAVDVTTKKLTLKRASEICPSPSGDMIWKYR